MLAILILSGCSPGAETLPPPPTELPSIQARGSFLVDSVSPLEISFNPEGGPLKGKGTIELDGIVYDVTMSGTSQPDGTAEGNLILDNSELALKWQFDWIGLSSDGTFHGEFSTSDDAGEVLDTYEFELTY